MAGLRVPVLDPTPELLLKIWEKGDCACLPNKRWPNREAILKQMGAGERFHDNAAVCLMTSGSSGPPKIVGLTLASLEANARSLIQPLELHAKSRYLLSLPLYHVSGLGILFRCLLSGAKWVDHEPATHVSMVPTQLLRASSLPYQKILLGGAPLPQVAPPIHTTYGLTEMGSSVLFDHRLLNNRAIKLVNGEIYLKGESLFLGYWKGFWERPLIDGWFQTGDLASEKEGLFTILGRKDRMFISGGENIHPETIEQALLESGAQFAYVVPVPDPLFGNRPVAFIQGTLKKGLETLPKFMHPIAFFPAPFNPPFKPNQSEFISLAINNLKHISGQKLPPFL
jgi:O-succinylbenzoic acid--CoA ligase